MSSLNKNLQKINKQLDMKVDIVGSEFQIVLDKISNSDLYKSKFFISSLFIPFLRKTTPQVL